eukprot:9607082-Karenia_brevis.AAC.1
MAWRTWLRRPTARLAHSRQRARAYPQGSLKGRRARRIVGTSARCLGPGVWTSRGWRTSHAGSTSSY